MPAPESFLDRAAEPDVRGWLHRPDQPRGDGLILTHGAGSNAQAPLLISLANEFAAAGFVVLRCDLPYRQARSYGPPGPGDAVRDRAGLKNAVAAMQKLVSGRLFLGGHSYGGRQATMLCAEEPSLVDGLLLLSYPLHPPRKPQQLRTQHLPNLRAPSLFVEGTRDPFATVDEIKAALKLIPAKTDLLEIEGAGHDLDFKKEKVFRNKLPEKVLGEFRGFFGNN